MDNSTEEIKNLLSSESSLNGFDTVDSLKRVKRGEAAKVQKKHATYGLNKNFIDMDVEMATPGGKWIHVKKKIITKTSFI